MSDNEGNKELTSNVPSKERRELTVQNKMFLNLLLEGKSTLEAYKASGYKGSNHAAYQLRSDLKEELIKALEGQGIDKAGLLEGIKQLMSLPLDSNEVSRGVSVKTKLDILKLLAKTLPNEQNAQKPSITAFVVNTRVEQPKTPPIDITPI